MRNKGLCRKQGKSRLRACLVAVSAISSTSVEAPMKFLTLYPYSMYILLWCFEGTHTKFLYGQEWSHEIYRRVYSLCSR